MIAWRIHGLRMDDPAVLAKVDQANRRALSRYGNYVRVAARRSIRRRKSPSKPGNPPRNVTGLLKAGIMYGLDSTSKSVIIGAAKIAGGSDVPETLEYGSAFPRREKNVARRLRKIGGGGEIFASKRNTPGSFERLVDGGTQYVRYSILKTQKQVARANKINRRLYGPNMVMHQTYSRPYMGPADVAARAQLLPRIWRNSIKP